MTTGINSLLNLYPDKIIWLHFYNHEYIKDIPALSIRLTPIALNRGLMMKEVWHGAK
jgi:hypothetical protein